MGTMVVRHTILIISCSFLCFINFPSFSQNNKGVLRLIGEKQEPQDLVEKFKELNRPLVYYKNNIYSPDSVCFTVRRSAVNSVARTFDNHLVSRNNGEHFVKRKFNRELANRNFEGDVGARTYESFVDYRNAVEGFVQEKEVPKLDEPIKPEIIEDSKSISKSTTKALKKANKVSYSGKGCFWNSLGGLFGGCGGLGKGCFNLFAPKSARNISTVQVISEKDFFCRKLKDYAGFEMLGVQPTEKMQVIDIMGIRTVTAGYIDYY